MRANRSLRRLLLAALVLAGVPLGGVFVGQAHAIIGRPLTPMSYAGVARRTTRRTVYAAGAVGAAAAHPYPYYW